ncbi:MAG: transposase [Actinomycetota bacterium]|nr:transposase [Actinomycetota bacterium]
MDTKVTDARLGDLRRLAREARDHRAPSLALVWADGGYAGKLVTWVERRPRILLDIVRKPEGQRGLSVLPRRWVVEPTLSWITAHRRLARDYERTPEHSETWAKWAMIGNHDPPPRTRSRPPTMAETAAA